ncbi:MAG: hypothetical protein QM737_23355 [Ferruginibacter sp.]
MKKSISVLSALLVVTIALSGFKSVNAKTAPQLCSVDFTCYAPSGQGVNDMRLINAATGQVLTAQKISEQFRFYPGYAGTSFNFYVEIHVNSGTFASNDISHYAAIPLGSPVVVDCNPTLIDMDGGWFRCYSTPIPYNCRPGGCCINLIHLFNFTNCHN